VRAWADDGGGRFERCQPARWHRRGLIPTRLPMTFPIPSHRPGIDRVHGEPSRHQRHHDQVLIGLDGDRHPSGLAAVFSDQRQQLGEPVEPGIDPLLGHRPAGVVDQGDVIMPLGPVDPARDSHRPPFVSSDPRARQPAQRPNGQRSRRDTSPAGCRPSDWQGHRLHRDLQGRVARSGHLPAARPTPSPVTTPRVGDVSVIPASGSTGNPGLSH
jgi:hypothetical protein